MTPRVLLVTNDFPPSVGGIQVVQEELCARLDPDRLHVLAARHHDAAAFDAAVPYGVERVRAATLLPTPCVAAHVDRLVRRLRPDVVVFGSALPLSLLRPVVARHGVPTVTMVYGADVSVPARLPGSGVLRRVLTRADGIVALGPFVAAEVRRACGEADLDLCVVVPGVDVDRFHPGDAAAARRRLGLDPDRPTLTSVSRLVPRKGMHLLVDAAARLRREIPDLQVAIGGTGREAGRLARRIAARRVGDCVSLLGRVPDDALVDVHLAADVSTMLCHDRWRGVEAEGFGIVFVEAAACARPVVAGRSGGAADAVVDGETGRVVDATDADAVDAAFLAYLRDPARARRAGAAGRARAVAELTWDDQAAVFVDWLRARFRPGTPP